MTEQEIIVELKKRWPEPHFKDWRVRENWGGSHMAECSVVGVEERFCERVVVATAGTHEKLLAAIRSLPVPSEPSGEDGGLLGLLQSLLQEPGSPPPIPTEAMAEFIIRDAASRLEHLENFKATVHSLLDEMGVRKYEGETCRIRRRLASLRTALRELAEVAKETSLDLSSMMDDASVGLASFTAPRGYLGDFESDIGKLGEVLAKHRELIDAGAPKKENP